VRDVVVPLRHALTAILATALATALVFGTVDYALAVPARGFVGALPGAQLLDYHRLFGRFTPLTDAFVRKQLHLQGGTQGAGGVGVPGGVGAPGQVAFPIGTTGGLPGTGAPIEVSHPFTNDNFRNAYVVPGLPFTAQTRPRTASRQPGEPTACSRSGGTAWYRYTSPATQKLEADTFGTSYADTLGVFEGSSYTSLHRVGCNSSAVGNAQVPFTASAGKTYYFQISGRPGNGKLWFHVGPLGRTELVSVTSSGAQADGDSQTSFISGNGRFVVFESGAPNLNGRQDPCTDVPLNSNTCGQIYVHDLLTGTTRLVSALPSGRPAVGLSVAPSISDDGRYVAFLSTASGLVPKLPSPGSCAGETAQFPLTSTRTALCLHLYRRDMATGAITLISQNRAGQPSNAMEFHYSMTSDGQYFAFLSDATNLVSGVRIPMCNPAFEASVQTGGGTHCTEAYWWHNGAIRLVTIRHDGQPATGEIVSVDVNATGRYVVFSGEDPSVQTRYHPPAGIPTMYVRDMTTGVTRFVCLSSSGAVANSECADLPDYTGHFMSDDGRYIVFASAASNLTPQSPRNQTTETDVIYARDLVLGTTSRLDIANDGSAGVGGPGVSTGTVVVSGNGRWAAFATADTNLSAQSKQGHVELYLRDLRTGALWLASLNNAGEAANNQVFAPSLSDDGSLVTFDTSASNLVAHDANAGMCPEDFGENCNDIYVHTNAGTTRG
jgi:Tol biopolymer transport system component